MIVIGLTGSLGMGKSTVATMLAKRGVTILDADKIVHALLDHDKEARQKIAKIFPSCLKHNKIDRAELFRCAKDQRGGIERLEKNIHPLVFKEMKRQIEAARQRKERAVVCEVPLLFESGFDRLCDVTLCVFCLRGEQKKRVLKRAGMTEEKFNALRKRQLSVTQKRLRADYMISTQTTHKQTEQRVERLMKRIGAL